MTSLHRFSPLLAVLALGTSGCFVEVDGDDDDFGTLTVQWSLDGTFDPDACLDYGARSLELVLYDHFDDVVDSFEARCADFAISIDLPEDDYGFDATLLDRSGRSVTTTIGLDNLFVDEGRERVVDIDFPVDSIR
jgi:hypothetical protein